MRQRLYYRARDRMNELEVRKSTGDILTPKEEQLVGLGDKLKTLESRTRGKAASATKAEKLGQDVKAKNLRAQAERGREDYINYALTNVKRMAVS